MNGALMGHSPLLCSLIRMQNGGLCKIWMEDVGESGSSLLRNLLCCSLIIKLHAVLVCRIEFICSSTATTKVFL